MQCLNKHCHNTLTEHIIQLIEGIIHYFSCNKCSIRIESRGKEFDFQDEHRDTPLLDFLYNVRLVYRHELHRKKANQLPKGFKIENAQKTDFKCPNCSHPLTHYHVFETNGMVS